jgi:hypothetical protein
MQQQLTEPRAKRDGRAEHQADHARHLDGADDRFGVDVADRQQHGTC